MGEGLSRNRSLLNHSFYRRWVSGDLSLDELREYARQYFHVVAALPKWLRRSAIATRNAELLDHAAEEKAHVALWLQFAEALGVSAGEVVASRPNHATAALIQNGDDFSKGLPGVAVAWAIECQAAEVSAEKARGLAAHYGIQGDAGGAYFDLHKSLEPIHTAELEKVIYGFDLDARGRARFIAEAMVDHQWELLTSVEQTQR